MTSSLVGSEMCIRDRRLCPASNVDLNAIHGPSRLGLRVFLLGRNNDPVSYTHLTLPTICSV
eukprot:68632-Prorocentrum_lima.AAC.1